MKHGILLVAFGAGNACGAATLRHMQALTEKRFRLPVRWAFTSGTMRERLAVARTKSDSVLKALRRMRYERYTHVAVQSLHIIPGHEYSGVCADVRLAGAEGSLRLAVGEPLLRDDADADEAARALLRHLPPSRLPGEPVVCMAHGTEREAQRLYIGWGNAVSRMDSAVHVACMKGSRTLDSLLPELTRRPGGRLWLLPLLSVVGRHSLEDMAGDGSESWKSRLERAGFACVTDLRGLADGPSFAELWLQRLAGAVAALDVQGPAGK
ncbi:MAG: sirohydrochlorin cobaltochelatase [Desulfovibrionaceae bacterium]|nr:sirohydrochlorin cobaltochelatase [Desulfovibrionaceae bacterium]